MHSTVSDVRESYFRLLNHIPGLVYQCRILPPESPGAGHSYVLEFASSGCYDLLGLTPEDMLRNSWNTIERMTPPEDLAEVRRVMEASFAERRPYQLYYRQILPSGRVKWIWDQGEGIYRPGEAEPYCLQGLMLDISDQKFVELELQEENRRLKATMEHADGLGPMVGSSPAMRRMYTQILRAAETDANVIIYGETGTGKDLAAQAIHAFSGRRGPYVPVNCGAIPEQLMESEFFGHARGAFSGAYTAKTGYIEAARDGTLFLDEIGELPLHLQVKLLRALENRMYTPVGDHSPKTASFRLIAATNRDLGALVREGKMRSDFYYRVHVLSLTVPPLRERQGDIALLTEAWLERRGMSAMLPLHVREAMERYTWPGNVRELHNFLDRYAAFGEAALESLGEAGSLSALTLPRAGLNLEDATLRLEETLIRQALDQCRGRRGQAAAVLGLNLRTLQRKMKRLGLK
ncbi:MAG: sigma 54-interacting transcriptional regulator [Desulfovibrionaceae bacterium]|nr:sigma 54-interacting transcriptional regulator [Desulfovibrionaceae bacterium]